MKQIGQKFIDLFIAGAQAQPPTPPPDVQFSARPLVWILIAVILYKIFK